MQDQQGDLAAAMHRVAAAARTTQPRPNRRDRRRFLALTRRVKVRRGATLCRRRHVRGA